MHCPKLLLAQVRGGLAHGEELLGLTRQIFRINVVRMLEYLGETVLPQGQTQCVLADNPNGRDPKIYRLCAIVGIGK